MLKAGKAVGEIATDEKLPYITVYRLATGESYKKLGAALKARSKKLKLTPDLRSWIVDVKKRKNWTHGRIGAKVGVTATTIGRVLDEERRLLAARVQSLCLSSGSNAAARTKYRLTQFEVEALLEMANEKPIPLKLKKQLEED